MFPYLLLHCSLELLYSMSSVVEIQRDWVFVLAREQDIPELLYKCQKLGSSQILVIHHFLQVMVSSKIRRQSKKKSLFRFRLRGL